MALDSEPELSPPPVQVLGDVITFTPDEAARVHEIASHGELKTSIGRSMLAGAEVVIPNSYGPDLYDAYGSAALDILAMKWRGVQVADETNTELAEYIERLAAISQFRPKSPSGERF